MPSVYTFVASVNTANILQCNEEQVVHVERVGTFEEGRPPHIWVPGAKPQKIGCRCRLKTLVSLA